MSMLYTVAFPEIGLAPREAIEHLRKQHDGPRAATLPAHFVLVAGCDALPQEVYLAHIAAIAAACKPVVFRCRYAMLGFDAERELSSVGLVPEEGYAAMSLLHDRLYSGSLERYLRTDLPFTPNIGIGALSNARRAKQVCDELNARGVDVEGTVWGLSVGMIREQRYLELASFDLRG